MSDIPLLSPNVLVGGTDPVGRARQYLSRHDGSEDDVVEMVTMALNAASGRMERHTRRRLRARTYRDAVTISATSTVDTTALTGSGFSDLKVDDDALGANLAAGSRVQSITNDGALVLTRKATASGAASVTFGSLPLVASGHGTVDIQIPEYPVDEVFSAGWLDGTGTKTAIDLTGARLDRATGRLSLSTSVAPRGDLNIEIECRAGYRPPTAAAGGDWEDWNDLEQMCLRLVQVMFQDRHLGRTGDISIVQFTQHVQSFKLPEDIAEGLSKFVRIW